MNEIRTFHVKSFSRRSFKISPSKYVKTFKIFVKTSHLSPTQKICFKKARMRQTSQEDYSNIYEISSKRETKIKCSKEVLAAEKQKEIKQVQTMTS